MLDGPILVREAKSLQLNMAGMDAGKLGKVCENSWWLWLPLFCGVFLAALPCDHGLEKNSVKSSTLAR